MLSHWNPQTDAYARNEELMLDWQGHVSAPQYQPPCVVLDDIQDDTAFGSSLAISAAGADHIDS